MDIRDLKKNNNTDYLEKIHLGGFNWLGMVEETRNSYRIFHKTISWDTQNEMGESN